jgi:hypothetical protein
MTTIYINYIEKKKSMLNLKNKLGIIKKSYNKYKQLLKINQKIKNKIKDIRNKKI